MEFRLTYDGPLPSAQNGQSPTKRDIKHNMRTVFHHQLKRLWDTTPFLKTGEKWPFGASARERPE